MQKNKFSCRISSQNSSGLLHQRLTLYKSTETCFCMAICSHKSCKNEVEDPKYKMCEKHREQGREQTKRKRAKALAEAQNKDYYICSRCSKKISKDEICGSLCSPCKWKAYKDRALNMGLPFELGERGFHYFCKNPCFWCGSKGKPANGVDRFDNTKGYTTQNAKPCCETCNMAKGDLPPDVFIEMCFEITERHISLERLELLLKNKQK